TAACGGSDGRESQTQAAHTTFRACVCLSRPSDSAREAGHAGSPSARLRFSVSPCESASPSSPYHRLRTIGGGGSMMIVTRVTGVRSAFALAFCVLMLPALAQAQSIAGIVRDTSGAVLPGVTVEASSAVLIEKTRAVVTDDRGQYQIVDLRPGTYKVTFALPGFATVAREAIELSCSGV